MEALFECRYKMDEKTCRRLSLLTLPKLLFITAAIILVLNINKEIGIGIVLASSALIIVANIWAFLIWVPRKMARNYRQLKGDPLPDTVVRGYVDEITVSEGEDISHYRYEQVLTTRAVAGIYMLMLTKQNGILLRPDSFTIGSLDTVRELVRQKSNAKKIR